MSVLFLPNEVLGTLLFQLNEIDMKNGREMVTSQKTKNLSNLDKKVNSWFEEHGDYDDCDNYDE